MLQSKGRPVRSFWRVASGVDVVHPKGVEELHPVLVGEVDDVAGGTFAQNLDVLLRDLPLRLVGVAAIEDAVDRRSLDEAQRVRHVLLDRFNRNGPLTAS